MSQYYLMQDAKRCINCKACEVVCKVNKGLPKGPKPCEVIAVGPKFISGLPRAFFKFMPCFHCERPWCISACPTGAMQKREDGIVYVDDSLCVGCKACMAACPWGVPQWNPEKRKVIKCDYCMDRLDKGLLPACVTVCVTKCLHFGNANEVPPIRRERAARTTAYFE